MAPTATLSFATNPSRPASSPASSSSTPVSITGPLGLLQVGGVSVGSKQVTVLDGTNVYRGFSVVERDLEGATLWWRGQEIHYGSRRTGIWTLTLWGASPTDAVNLQRILLRLPPLAVGPVEGQAHSPAVKHISSSSYVPPSRPRKLPSLPDLASPHPTFRNSLILIDEDSRDILDVLTLAPSPHQHHLSEQDNLKPRHHSEIPPPNSPGAKLAREVDEITRAMFPGDRLEPSEVSSHGTPAHDGQSWDDIERDGEQTWIDDVSQVQVVVPSAEAGQSEEELKSPDGLAIPPLLRGRASVGTLSSLATFGTGGEGWVTAEEGLTSGTSSRAASEWEDFTNRLSLATQRPEIPANDVTSKQPHISPESFFPSPISTICHPLEPSEPNAVLLQFLGSGPGSTLRMRKVTREDIPLVKGLKSGELNAWNQLSSWFSFASLGSWFAGWSWWSSSDKTSAQQPQTSAPIVETSSYLSSYFAPPFASNSTLAPKARPLRHRANGEETSRTSIMWFDGEGVGRRAYVEGAGANKPLWEFTVPMFDNIYDPSGKTTSSRFATRLGEAIFYKRIQFRSKKKENHQLDHSDLSTFSIIATLSTIS
ncbi:hypothetical protein T439DRAFT_372528 [Meredithblackwellia eburnea MCA 4105]